MTREEAIARIKDHIEIHRYHERNAVKIFEALDMAIKALEQEPCEDAVSRKAAIDAALSAFSRGLLASPDIRKLPSAQPERKGKWIEMGTNKDGTHSIRCSKCGGGYKTRGHARSIATKAKYKFCPNCGAYMRGENKESEVEE